MVCAEQTKYFSVELLMGHVKKKTREGSRTNQNPHTNTQHWTLLPSLHVKLFETTLSPEEHILVYINRNSPGLKNKGSFLNIFRDSITLSNFSFK